MWLVKEFLPQREDDDAENTSIRLSPRDSAEDLDAGYIKYRHGSPSIPNSARTRCFTLEQNNGGYS